MKSPIKLFLLASIFTIFASGCASLDITNPASTSIKAPDVISQMVINNISKLPTQTVAVIDFCDLNGNSSQYGKLLAERIITQLVQQNGINVVERARIQKIMDEKKLTLSGLVDQSNSKMVGLLLNVDALVIGTVTQVLNNYEINARLINTNNGLIIGAVNAREACENIKSSETQYPRESLPTYNQPPNTQPYSEPNPIIKSNSNSVTPDNETVYITKTGAKYHKGNCSYLSNSKIPFSKSEAISAGYTPCSVCYPTSNTNTQYNNNTNSNPSKTNSEMVYITRTGTKYHRADCRYLSSSEIIISKQDAINKGYTPCSVCNP